MSNPWIALKEVGKAWNKADPLKLNQENKSEVLLIENIADLTEKSVRLVISAAYLVYLVLWYASLSLVL